MALIKLNSFYAALFSLLLVCFLLIYLAPQASAQDTRDYKYVPFNWYFLIGLSQGECYSSCVSNCLPACLSAAAGGGIDSSGCGGTCASSCTQCSGYFTSTQAPADDGLPPQIPVLNTPPLEVAGITIDGVKPESNLPPAGITVGGEKVESNLPEAGVTVGSQDCPAFARDGHPMIWDPIWGCYDSRWKDDYCIRGNSCDSCAGLQGCIWNGAACLACNSPTCIFVCPRSGGAPIKAEQKDIPTPTPSSVSQKPVPSASITPSAIPSVVASIQPSASASATPLPTVLPAPIPSGDAVNCFTYSNCSSCANAPKKDDESQCGWSVFLNACLDPDTWRQVNASGLKVGWTTEQEYCREQKEDYCFEYADCFSCAGKAGLSRRCSWSMKDSKCVPYDSLASFQTADNPEANNIILPSFCPVKDCFKYSDCTSCEQNALCLWSKEGGNCVKYKGDGEGAYFYPSNCPKKAIVTPTLVPVKCPKDCSCDDNSKILSCNGVSVNVTGIILSDRVSLNAQISTSMQKVDEVIFSKDDQTYVVRGHRTGLLLFILPIQVDITATINAETGAVEKTVSSWWSFLTG